MPSSLSRKSIYKANALVEASYRLSLAEQRIVLACIAQIRRGEEVTDDVMYEVSAAQMAEMAGTDVKTAYRDLKAAADRLFDRRVAFFEQPLGTPSRTVLITRWVQSVRYVEAEGRVELRFSRDILPYLTRLQVEFTRYPLSDVAKMNSVYAIRLYEMLVQWDGAGTRTVDIPWLREAFQLEARYPAFKDFRRWVIEPAVAQVNEHTSLVITSWKTIRTGRKTTHVKFNFRAKTPEEGGRRRIKGGGKGSAQGKVEKGFLGLSRAFIDQHREEGESVEDAALRLKRMGH